MCERRPEGFLAGAATSSDEISVVVETALDWVRSDELTLFKERGPLSSPCRNCLSGAERVISELAKHTQSIECARK